ncbi:MAG: hypothetical protein GX769_00625 [Erysipelothrix sp.]|nr:hypothetical protein [Erysipelothrix sp.]
MKEIGMFLKENRIKQALTIKDIADKTKMNINIIKNIEAGNVSYFENDLTYLRYYVRSYSNAVNVDFDSLEKELDKASIDYTQSMAILEKEKMKTLNENIKVKRQQFSQPPSKGGFRKTRGSVDWTLVSLITIVALIAGFLIYSIAINLVNKDNPTDVPPVIDNPVDKPDDEKDPIEEQPIIADLKITKEDPNTYLITNWQQQKDFNIKTVFVVNTWTQIQVNDQVVNIPQDNNLSKTFAPGEELVLKDKYTLNEVEQEFKAGDVISIRYGIMRGNKFVINNEDYQLDASIADVSGPTSVIFKLDQEVE